MDSTLLDDDWAEGFEPGIDLWHLKDLGNAHEAHLLRSRLEAEGIRCCISHQHSHQVLPSVATRLSLYVRRDEAEKALQVLAEVEALQQAEPDYRDADHEDIAFAKALHEGGAKAPIWWLLLPLLLLALLAMWDSTCRGN